MALRDRILNADKYNGHNFENKGTGFNAVCFDAIKQLSEKAVDIPVWFDYSYDEKLNLVTNFVKSFVIANGIENKISVSDETQLKNILLNSVNGFGIVDLLLLKEDVKTVIVSETKDISCVLSNGNVVKSSIFFDADSYSNLLSKLVKLSGKDSPVLRFRIDKFAITILKEPVCVPKLIIEKINIAKDGIGYSLYALPDETVSLLSDIINSGKKVLISSSMQTHIDEFVNIVLNNIDKEKLSVLFEEENIFPIPKNIESYCVSNLSAREKSIILKTLIERKPDYIFDTTGTLDIATNIIFSSYTDLSYILSVISYSATDAISLISSTFASKKGGAEKLAKKAVAEYFDFVVQLGEYEGEPRVISICELSVNKSGTPVLKELTDCSQGVYSYDEEALKTCRIILGKNSKFPLKNMNKTFVSRFENEINKN